MKYLTFNVTMTREAQRLYALTCIARAVIYKTYQVPTETPKDGLCLAKLLAVNDYNLKLAEIHVYQNFVRIVAKDSDGLPFDSGIIDHVGMTRIHINQL